MLEAMQAIGYKKLRAPGKTELTESDIDEATKFYTEAELFNTVLPDGRNIGSGRLNDRGEWEFDVSDEEVKNSAIGMDVAVQKRKAIKVYMEQSAQRAYNLIPVKDETAQSERIRREEERLQTKAILEAAKDEANKVVYPPIIPFTEPARLSTGEGVVEADALKVKASVSGRTFRFNMSGRLVDSELEKQGKAVSNESKELLTGDVKVEVKNVIHDDRTGEIIGFDLNTGPGLIEGALLSIDGTPIKNVTVTRGSDAFDEVYTSIMQIAAPSKTKRSGAEFLESATFSAMEYLDIEPPSDAALERSNNYMGAMQTIAVSMGSDLMNSIADVVGAMPLKERIAMETRIFEEVSKGNYPTVVDGEVKFPE